MAILSSIALVRWCMDNAKKTRETWASLRVFIVPTYVESALSAVSSAYQVNPPRSLIVIRGTLSATKPSSKCARPTNRLAIAMFFLFILSLAKPIDAF